MFIFILGPSRAAALTLQQHNEHKWKRSLMEPDRTTALAQSRSGDSNHIESTDQPVFEESEVGHSCKTVLKI